MQNYDTVLLAIQKFSDTNAKIFVINQKSILIMNRHTLFYEKFTLFLDTVYIERESLFSSKYNIQFDYNENQIINHILRDTRCNKIKYCFQQQQLIKYHYIEDNIAKEAEEHVKNIFKRLNQYNSIHIIVKFKVKKKVLMIVIQDIILSNRKMFYI